MAILDIAKYGNPVLAQPASEVETITPELVDLGLNMIQTMYSADGIGLAAPQVAKSIRMVAVDVPFADDTPEISVGERLLMDFMPFVMVNPKITPVSDITTGIEEGCLSLPNINGFVERYKLVELTATIIISQGKAIAPLPISVICDNLLSICIQHEIDHLDGKLFVDRMEVTDLKAIKVPLKKLKKQTLKNLG